MQISRLVRWTINYHVFFVLIFRVLQAMSLRLYRDRSGYYHLLLFPHIPINPLCMYACMLIAFLFKISQSVTTKRMLAELFHDEEAFMTD